MSFTANRQMEHDVCSCLREAIERHIKHKRYTTESLAEILGLLPTGVELLFARDLWDVSTALQIAETLEIRVELFIYYRGNK